MEIVQIILFFISMLLLALLIQPFAERLSVPFSLMLVIVGFTGSELLVRAGIDTGLRWYHFHDLVIYVFLPILIFESALHLNARLLLRNLFLILVLAIPILLLSTGITAILLYYGIAHPTGFPWIAALLTGVLLSATDPVAVVEIMKKVNAPERLVVLIDGESLFNDATAIVFFNVFLSIALIGNSSASWLDHTQVFALTFFGGIVVGAVTGFLTGLLIRLQESSVLKAIASIIGAYGAFLLAEEWLHVSGVMAVLVAGLWVGWMKQSESAAENVFMFQLWEFNAYIANIMIFLLVGVTITSDMFSAQWLAMLIGILAVLIARALGIFAFIPLVSRIPGVEPINRHYQTALYWGGIRGAVALALALSLPVSLDYWWTIQSIAYGVVLFTLFVQAPTMQPLMRRLKL